MSAPSLRPARPEDAETVAAISRAAYAGYVAVLGREPKPMVQDYGGLVARGAVTLLEAGGAAAGVLVLEPAADHLLIYSVALLPTAQGKGWGRLLMAEAEARAAALGLPELRLYTNERMTRNLAFYRSLGYAETGRKPHARFPDSILVYMSKRLG